MIGNIYWSVATAMALPHDFPQRVVYRRCGVQLCAGIEGLAGGKALSITWRYDRVTP